MSAPRTKTDDARERSLGYFAAGFNCAEAVLIGVTEAMSVQCAVAPSIATGFGAGMARNGETCGAVVGGVMAIGVLRGRRHPGDEVAKTATYSAVSDLIRGFGKEHGTLYCRELTGCDMQTEEGLKKADSLNLHQNLCPKFVALAAELAASALDYRG